MTMYYVLWNNCDLLPVQQNKTDIIWCEKEAKAIDEEFITHQLSIQKLSQNYIELYLIYLSDQ